MRYLTLTCFLFLLTANAWADDGHILDFLMPQESKAMTETKQHQEQTRQTVELRRIANALEEIVTILKEKQ